MKRHFQNHVVPSHREIGFLTKPDDSVLTKGSRNKSHEQPDPQS